MSEPIQAIFSIFYILSGTVCVCIACVNGVLRDEAKRNYAKAAFFMAWATYFLVLLRHPS